jgi:hypothetical protein
MASGSGTFLDWESVLFSSNMSGTPVGPQGVPARSRSRSRNGQPLLAQLPAEDPTQANGRERALRTAVALTVDTADEISRDLYEQDVHPTISDLEDLASRYMVALLQANGYSVEDAHRHRREIRRGNE